MQFSIRGGEKQLKKRILQRAHEMESDLVEIMKYVGEKAVREARIRTKSDGGFDDVTGNLRSSIGYAIMKNGEVIFQNISGNPTALKAFWDAVKDRLRRTDNYQLFLLAGMEYASHVESKGYNVITSEGTTMIVDLRDLFKKYKAKLQMRV